MCHLSTGNVREAPVSVTASLPGQCEQRIIKQPRQTEPKTNENKRPAEKETKLKMTEVGKVPSSAGAEKQSFSWTSVLAVHSKRKLWNPVFGID